MAFEQRFKGGKGEFYSYTFGNTHPFHIYLSKGPSWMLTHEKLLPTAMTRCMHSPWAHEELCYSLIQSVLTFLFSYTCSHSLVSIGEWHTQLNKNNLRLINCSSLFLNHTTSITSPCILILMIDISQHPFTFPTKLLFIHPFHTNTTFPCLIYKECSSQVAHWERICLPMEETWVWSLGWEDPLKEEMATHPSICAWEIHGQRSPAGCCPWGHRVSQD